MLCIAFRKALKSIQERGFASTLSHIWRQALVKGMRYLDANFDRRFGTETTEIVELSDLVIGSENAKNGIYYEGIPERVLRDILDGLGIDYTQYTFVDFGSGKGRALMIASDYPFRRILGVEFAPALHEVALSNLKKYRASSQKCKDVQSICADATTWDLPQESIVAFLYTPFKPPVLQVVVDRLMATYWTSQHSLVLAFYGNEPVSLGILKHTGLRCRELVIRRDWTHTVQRLAIVLDKPVR